jgi:hypothetical protein
MFQRFQQYNEFSYFSISFLSSIIQKRFAIDDLSDSRHIWSIIGKSLLNQTQSWNFLNETSIFFEQMTKARFKHV